MAKYYKVPVKEILFEDSEEVLSVVPDIPDNIPFIGQKIGNNFFIKVNQELTQDSAVELNNIPEQLLKCRVKGVRNG